MADKEKQKKFEQLRSLAQRVEGETAASDGRRRKRKRGSRIQTSKDRTTEGEEIRRQEIEDCCG